MPHRARSIAARFQIILVAISVITTLPVCSGCRSVPHSGRKQLVVIPESQEISMGASAYQEILAKERLSTNERYIELVQRVGQRIAAVAGRDDYQWEFNVIDSQQPNAFCLPGGKVAFNEGILPICRNEAGIAVVMSHEVSHALARHGGERMSHGVARNAGGLFLKFLFRSRSEHDQQLIRQAYGFGTEYGAILPYSRKHESEADAIGLTLMAKAGYDPAEAVRFWERFAALKQGKQTPEFFSTHPTDARRAADLRDLQSEAQQHYAQARQKYGTGELIAREWTASQIQPVSGER